MNRIPVLSSLAILGGLLCLSPSLIAEIPDWIGPDRDNGPPVWISAHQGTEKSLELEAIPLEIRDRVRRKLEIIRGQKAQAKVEGELTPFGNRCVVWSVVSGVKAPLGGKTLLDLLNESHAVSVGKIVGIKQGFAWGFPGSLLVVEVEKVLKGEVASSERRLLVHFEHAEVPVAGEILCSKSQRYPHLPLAGERIVVFQRSSSSGSVLHARDTELIYERLDASIDSPPGLEMSVESGFDHLVSALEEAVR